MDCSIDLVMNEEPINLQGTQQSTFKKCSISWILFIA